MRHIAWALPVLAVVLLALHLWQLEIAHDQLQAQTLERETAHVAALADTKASQIEARLSNADQQLRRFRDEYARGHLDAARDWAEASMDAYAEGMVVDFSVVDAQGRVEFSTLRDSGMRFALSPAFLARLAARHADTSALDKPQYAAQAAAWALPLARPIFKDGRFAGAVALWLSPHLLSAELARPAVAENDAIALISEDGSYVARHRDIDRMLGTSAPAGRPFLLPAAAEQGVFSERAQVDQRPKVFGWRRLLAYPLVLVVRMDKGDMLAPVSAEIARARLRTAVGAPLVLALVAALSWLLLRSARQQGQDLARGALVRATLDATADGILVIGPGGQVLDSNQRFRELWRIPQELVARGQDEALLQHVASQLEDPEGFVRGVQALYESDARQHDLLHFTDGRIFERYTQPVALDHRQARLWSFRDVTEAQRAALALRTSEERLRMAQEGAQVGIWEWDPRRKQIYWSPECVRIYGLDPGTPPDQALWRSLVDAQDLPLIDAQWDLHIARGEPFEVEYRLHPPGGAMRWLVTKGRAHRDAAGQVLRLSGINLDITERKQTETRLRQLSLAVEQSPVAIAITNLDASIEYVNEAFLRSTGYTHAEVIGQNPRVLHSGHTPPETFTEMWAALTDGRAWEGELHNRRKDGSEYIESAVIAPIRAPDGRITHYLGVKTDISEMRRLLAEVQGHRAHLEELVDQRTLQLAEARDRAEAASRAKSAFLANVSHEIRTPLNAITGMAYLMRRSGLDAAQTQRLDRIETAGQHLIETINAVLDLSKIEAGRFTLEEGPVDVPALFANVASMLHDELQTKRLALSIDLPAALPTLVGDAPRLQQALLNYASNAVKFTERGDVVLRAMLAGQGDQDVLLRVEVEDTGVGIEAPAIPRLFTAFEQADNSTTRQYGGTGLGLSITKRLAELMGGSVGVRSTPGVGSTFWFTARLRRGKVQPSARSTGAPGDAARESARETLRREHRGRRVLVVEDEIVNREVTLAVLAEVGLECDVAADGVEAVERAAATRYDLILMDMQMPRMDGLQAARLIRAQASGACPPVLAMTANAFAEDKARCREAGMSDFITKPVDAQTLYATLLRWLPTPGGAPPGSG
jgi:PAS domain S-box-containing protein